MNAFAHFEILYTIIFVLSRGMSEISEFLRDLCKKVSKKGLTNEFCWCIISCVKAKASLGVSAQRRYFTFRNPKTILYYEEGKDVFNVVGGAPTVKGVFSFFNKEETVCRM